MGRRPRRGVEGLVDRVARACRERGLLERGPVAVAVSGGVDSMVLMHLLAELGVAERVITLDHGLRPGSAGEVRAVARAAEALGLEVIRGELGLSPGPNVAARARRARYAFFDALSPEIAGTIALAHHRDDQAETVLDRLIRGAGCGGLAGMGWRRGRYVRPLLAEPRAAIRAWARARGISWVEDPSNAAGTRGALRHRVLPVLEALRPGAAAAAARSAGLLAEDEALLRAMAAELLVEDGLERRRWEAAPPPLRRRALLALVAASQGGAGGIHAAQIEAALRMERGALTLPGGWRLAADPDRLRCLPPPPEPARLQRGRWGLWQIEAAAPVSLRAPRPGERLGGRPLAEALRAAGVPPSLRPYHPVIGAGGTIWVPGVSHRRGAGSLAVSAHRPPGPSWPGGGPYRQEL